MPDNQPIKYDLEKMRRNSRRLRIVVIVLTVVIIGVIWLTGRLLTNRRHQQRVADSIVAVAIEAENDSIRTAEWARQRHIKDSIKDANRPSYTIDDVYELVRTKAPQYSWVYLWRMDNDNWIMTYKTEDNSREHCYIQRFNPTARTFRPAIEYATVRYKNLTDDKGVCTRHNQERVRFEEYDRGNTLRYYEDGKLIGTYTRDGIENDCSIPSSGQGPLTRKRIQALRNAPPEWAEDGYESAEDWYYDNEEDLYLYYER